MRLKLDHGMGEDQIKFISKVEKKKDAKFLGCFPVGGYNGIVYCFADAKGYFGLYEHRSKDCLMIVDAKGIAGKDFYGITKKDGAILYSRFRHDMRESEAGTVDGGWGYFKYSLKDGAKVVTMKIIGDEVVLGG